MPTSLIRTSATATVTDFGHGPTKAVRDMLRGEGTYATTVLVWAIDHFGFDPETKQPNVFIWAPETIMHEIRRDTGVEPIKLTFDKLMAAITIVTTDLFFKDLSRFLVLATVLSGEEFQPDEVSHPDSAETAWALTEALLLSPPDEDEPFCGDIRHYISHLLKEEGYVTPPDILRIAIGADLSNQVRFNFSDDPEMFSMIYQNQQDKSDDVDAVIRQGTQELVQQLKALPLREGTTKELEERVGSIAQKAEAASDAASQLGGPQ